MIRESIEKESREKSSKSIKIVLETPKNSSIPSRRKKRVRSHQKPASHGRNFEGLYFQSSENYLNNDMHFLYQGGTPINEVEENENYKPVPLSVAKINFRSEIRPVKYNRDYYDSKYQSGPTKFEYEKSKQNSRKCSVVNLTPFEGTSPADSFRATYFQKAEIRPFSKKTMSRAKHQLERHPTEK
uniref:Uncharacterized protein n=1 Tax=Euplotes crassus TaxID=5936 RepID=A0A7S3P1B2_EUPCR|mmetsp:Transcript_6958/g.6491  ORF Transcript_6958/g.6491 Transcript_6958/m.6491 type:complete len:185 (+) Transcript_6958:365-919(+)